ncbi:MAG: hypothetical protein AAF184_16265 [Pseudomonadota bacterium]
MPDRTIFTATKEELTNEPLARRRWLAARNEPLSRREWPDAIARSIFGFEGTILCPNKWVWPLPEVDKILGDPRWFSYYFEETDGHPRRTPRLLERVRLIDLYYRIEKPAIARHFALGPIETSPMSPPDRTPSDRSVGTLWPPDLNSRK